MMTTTTMMMMMMLWCGVVTLGLLPSPRKSKLAMFSSGRANPEQHTHMMTVMMMMVMMMTVMWWLLTLCLEGVALDLGHHQAHVLRPLRLMTTIIHTGKELAPNARRIRT
jgi:hypothetical protein